MAWAQISPRVQGTLPASQSSLQAILQQRRALFQQEQALRAQGANAQTIQAWHQQHAAQFTALNQQLQAWSASQPQRIMPIIQDISIPANATPEMEEFLQNQALLANSRAQLHNQALATGNAAVSPAATEQSWRQQNAALLKRQQQLAQVLAQQQAQTPLKLPPATPLIPANASPQLRAFLTTRNELMREEIQRHNQIPHRRPGSEAGGSATVAAAERGPSSADAAIGASLGETKYTVRRILWAYVD